MNHLETIVSTVKDSISEFTSFCLIVFWLEDDGDRENTCRSLSRILADTRIIPHVLRRPIFRDSNAWAGDAISVLDTMKESVLERSLDNQDAPIGLIIVSRSKLNVSQAASPALAPAWLPGFGGREIMVFTRDVRSIAACSLASDEASVPFIKSSLFLLELALLKAAKTAASKDRHHGQKLWGQLIKERSGANTRSEFIVSWEEGVRAVTDPESYRPSLTFGWSMISAIWSTFLIASPDQLLSRSEAFVEYFGIDVKWLPTQPDPCALLPIIFRGALDHSKSPDLVAARGLILTVGLACQLVTAAAHADQYGRVSAPALNALSLELRRALMAAERQALWRAQLGT